MRKITKNSKKKANYISEKTQKNGGTKNAQYQQQI